MTDTDREYISAGENVDSHKRYQAISRVRNRITEELATDVELLREHHPDLLEELRDVVCEEPTIERNQVGRDPSEPADEAPREQTDPVREAAGKAVDQHWVQSWEGRRDEAVEALIGLYEELKTLPDGQQKSDFLELYSQYQGPYPEDEYPNAGTKKGGWYRKFVSECLEEMPGVERYGQNGRRWRYVGENDE
jgi:hypothetical protein